MAKGDKRKVTKAAGLEVQMWVESAKEYLVLKYSDEDNQWYAEVYSTKTRKRVPGPSFCDRRALLGQLQHDTAMERWDTLAEAVDDLASTIMVERKKLISLPPHGDTSMFGPMYSKDTEQDDKAS
jgi:hypothetical protein